MKISVFTAAMAMALVSMHPSRAAAEENEASSPAPPSVVVVPSPRISADVHMGDDAPSHGAPDPSNRYPAAIPMTAAGFAVFGAAYAVSSLSGAIVADTRDDERLDLFGRRMLIPVVGPWLAIPHTESATAAWFTGFAGVMQGVGVVVGTIGAVRLGQRRAASQRVTFTSSPLPGGGQFGVAGRF